MCQSITTSNYTFEDTIRSNYLYVNKTIFFYQLVNEEKGFYFLSQPCRFGKSLSISILKNIFKGNKELFKGLKIYDKQYDWMPCPVINLNISQAPFESADILNKGLCAIMRDNAKEIGIEISDETHSGLLLKELINKAKDLGKVVILLDEYDTPLVENIYAPHIEEIRQVHENFYINIKASDEHLRIVFMTGVTKFSKVSIFSKLKKLRDITMSEAFATMYGYTQKEVEHYFGDRINELAAKNIVDRIECRQKIQKWYNGFRFHEDAPKVYNPVSLGMFFNKVGRFYNFWFSTGIPSFIFKILKQQNIDFFDTLFSPLDSVILDSFDVANMQAAPLLLQTGYLTIDRVEMLMDEPVYYLRFPNI
ncbi:MAG: AAA family ATPase [Mariniphaga sp.]